MGAPAIIALIAQFGVPLAEKLFNIVTTHFSTNSAPTAEMWQALRDAENTSHAAFAAALKSTNP